MKEKTWLHLIFFRVRFNNFFPVISFNNCFIPIFFFFFCILAFLYVLSNYFYYEKYTHMQITLMLIWTQIFICMCLPQTHNYIFICVTRTHTAYSEANISDTMLCKSVLLKSLNWCYYFSNLLPLNTRKISLSVHYFLSKLKKIF